MTVTYLSEPTKNSNIVNDVDNIPDTIALEKEALLKSKCEDADDFEWSTLPEPHQSRRAAIMKKYPEVKKLFGIDTTLKWRVCSVVILQIFFAYTVRNSAWWAVLLLAYTIGGTINHGMTLAMHEISHNLAFTKLFHNKTLGIIANLPFGIPAFASFKRYHREHHKYQGEDGIDTDIPTRIEGYLFTNAFLKTIWCICQPLFYALRPMAVVPKKPGKFEGVNFACQLVFDVIIWHFWGTKSLIYLIAGTLLGMGLHPMAGHFIAEHYTFIQSQETYSYYGPLNWFSYNVGYHNEHHDFPNIPGSRLPELRSLAPEFYDSMPYYTSWTRVIFDYIFSPVMGPFRRVKRSTLSEEVKQSVRLQ